MKNGGRVRSELALAFGALGIVFGDIGTSPIYALRSAIQSPGLPTGDTAIFGVASLIFWTLNLIVGLKYLFFITRVDNDGEGGVFALVTVLKQAISSKFGNFLLVSLIILSTALLFADSLITTPLSIMAAVEGIKTIHTQAEHFIIPLSLVIIFILFSVQRFGTSALSLLFSPIMLIWFVSIGAIGLFQIIQHPEILKAISPHYAVSLISLLTWPQIFSLFGSILLAATGAEAIYADMGHFGRKPIAIAWYFVAIVSLLLSYFGQSAWLLGQVKDLSDPFFSIVPEVFIIPMVFLATSASIIAGQAMISGMFSIVNQAINQGYLPRLKIVHTSESVRGQIYIPVVNYALMVGAFALTLGFQSAETLASSYGFAVSATMLLTTFAFTLVVWFVWKWSLTKLVIFMLFALPIDLLFVAATVTKLPSGYYIPVVVTMSVVWIMLAWHIGNLYLTERAQRIDIPVKDFSEIVGIRDDLYRQKRPAVFFQHLPFPLEARVTPFALLQQVQLTSMLYQPMVIVEFVSSNLPRIMSTDRISIIEHGQNIFLVHVKFGYREPWTMDPVVEIGLKRGWWAQESDIVYYSAREDLRFGSNGLPIIFKIAYAYLHRFDRRIFKILRLDPARCLEVGISIEI